MHQNRVVIVDDEPAVYELIRKAADGHGFESAVASDSHEFRRVYQSFDPALVFLDLNLPGGEDGVELLRFLAAQDCKARIALISGAGSKVLNTGARLALYHGLDLLTTLNKPITSAGLEKTFLQACRVNQPITEGDLRAALSNRELMVHYQPKVSLQSQPICAIEGAEALVRWRHPRYGCVTPDQFIPLTEASGLIDELTDFVLREALTQAARWRVAGLELVIAVNLSAPLLGDLSLPDRIDKQLRELGLSSAQLVLEVTESGVLADVGRAMETLTRLRLKGIRSSIDDFGKGHSSLVQLYQMPFSEVKIDRSFVGDLVRSEEAQVIVRSVIDLAHNLGMQVCAEGVEDRGSAELLRAWGCERAQGFLFAPAMASADFETFIRQGKPPFPTSGDAKAPAQGSGYRDVMRCLPPPMVGITT